ncbi:MAG TPA: TonB-dependent receptor [Sphingomonas sp.]|nr:TonB-dependent receptor [Sphingomonas sp.]
MSWKSIVLYSASGLALAAASAPAAAQDAGDTSPPADVQADAQDGEIVVTGIRESLEAAAAIKRESDQVVDSIVADDIGKFPDPTVAAALQRVPGVQVTIGSDNEVVGPLIRGLGDVFTTLNGREIFTGAGRGFSFQDLPAEALAGADVYKSNSANLIEGGVAGLVNLKLHRAFDFDDFTLAGSAKGTYSHQADKLNPAVGFLMADRWQTGIGEFGALVDISYSQNDYSQAIAFNSEARSTNIFPVGVAPRDVAAPTNVGGLNNFGSYKRPQINGSLQWRPSSDLELYADGLFSGYRSKYSTAFILYDSFSASKIDNVEVGDQCFDAYVSGAGFYADPDVDPSVTTQHFCQATAMTVHNVGTISSDQAHQAWTNLYLGAGGFKYNHGRLHLNGDVSYQYSKYTRHTFIMDIGKRVPQVDIITNVGGGTQYNAPGNPLNEPDDYKFINGLYQDNADSIGSLFAAQLDGTYDVGGILKNIQVGGRFADRKARTQQFIINIPVTALGVSVAGNGLPADFLSETPGIPQANGGDPWLIPDPDYLREGYIQNQLKTIFGIPTGTPDYDPTRGFEAGEKTYAGYLQGAYEFDLGGITADGLIGLRLTRTDRTITGSGTVITDGVPSIVAVTRDTSDTDLLPNASMRLKFGGGLQARFAYSKTLSRPGFGSLNPGLNYIVQTNPNIPNSGSSGNPDLRPQKADAFDATLEYYFNRSDYVAIGLFYKNIKDRVVNSVEPVVIDGISYQISRPRNLGSADLKGIEASTQTFFDFLPGALSGFGVYANFTYLDGQVTTPDDPLADVQLLGVSKYNFNAALLYEKYGLSVRAAYTYRSRYADGDDTPGFSLRPVDQEIFLNRVRPSGRLDISVGYEITKQITLSLDAINVTKSAYKSYWDDARNPRDIRSYDDLYAIGLRFQF